MTKPMEAMLFREWETYIKFKGDLDNWNMPGCRRNACQLNLTQQRIVSSGHTVAFENANEHRVLIVRRRCQISDLAGGQHCVALDDVVDVALTCFLDQMLV